MQLLKDSRCSHLSQLNYFISNFSTKITKIITNNNFFLSPNYRFFSYCCSPQSLFYENNSQRFSIDNFTIQFSRYWNSLDVLQVCNNETLSMQYSIEWGRKGKGKTLMMTIYSYIIEGFKVWQYLNIFVRIYEKISKSCTALKKKLGNQEKGRQWVERNKLHSYRDVECDWKSHF